MSPTSRALIALGAVTTLGVGAAAAQPSLPSSQPGVGAYDPNPGAPTAAARGPAPRAPVVVTFGADGQPIVGGPVDSGPKRYYHYDDAQLPSYDEEVEVYGGPTPELHVVGRGDTLWAICWYYFNDPWQWPKVWSYNPQITNPHWIYPGDLVRLLPKGFIAAITSAQPTTLDPDDSRGGAPVSAPTPDRAVEVQLHQVAFIDRKHLESAWRVVGSTEPRELLSIGDEIYVSYPKDDVPQVGQRYSVYAEDKQVKHPGSGDVIGSYVRILGEVEVLAVKQDKQARARITSVTSEIERGARVGPLLTRFKNVAPVANTVDAQGTIVAMLSNDLMVGSGEVVFLDLGKGDNVRPGNVLYVVRRGDAFDPVLKPDEQVGQSDDDYPARALGKVVLVQVGDTMSIGLVTLAVEEMGVGDHVLMRKQ